MKLRNIGDWPPAFGGAYHPRIHQFPQEEEGVLKDVNRVEAAPPDYPKTLPTHLNLTISFRGQQFDGDYQLGNHVDRIDTVLEKLKGCIGRPLCEMGDLEIKIPE